MELVNRAYVYSCMSSDCVLFELITLVWAVNFWRILENLYSIVTNGFDRLFVLMNGVYVLMCSAGISVRTEFHTGKSKYWTSLSEVRVNSLGHTTGYEFINQNEPNLKDVPHCLISASTAATVFCARNLCESVIVYFFEVLRSVPGGVAWSCMQHCVKYLGFVWNLENYSFELLCFFFIC